MDLEVGGGGGGQMWWGRGVHLTQCCGELVGGGGGREKIGTIRVLRSGRFCVAVSASIVVLHHCIVSFVILCCRFAFLSRA